MSKALFLPSARTGNRLGQSRQALWQSGSLSSVRNKV
jgi:hypothetical protein